MDTMQVEKNIVKILNNKNKIKNNKICILLEGAWGIGKTYTIENLPHNNEFNQEIIILSIFGKESIQDIEKSIVFKLLSASKNIIKNKRSGQYIKRIANDLSNNFLGIDIDKYINMVSIEDILSIIDGTKDYIICFDDLERKSSKVDMRSLIGLIERVKVNFDVLIITNSLKMDKDNLEVFNSYKEKVINHEIKFDKWNKEILIQILKDIEINQKAEIINIYLENKHNGNVNEMQESLFNIRFFIKYIELIVNTLENLQIKTLDKTILMLCKVVVYNYFSMSQDEIYFGINYNNRIKLNGLKKILLYEELTEDEKNEILNKTSEIRNDISTLFNSHILSEDKLNELLRKIEGKIDLKEKEYFVNENNIISLISAFEENRLLDIELQKKLLNIAIEMYLPEYNIKHAPIEKNVMDTYDLRGNKIQSSTIVIDFISKLNENCEKKFEKHIENEIELSKETQNYQSLLQLTNYYEVNEISEFEEIFDYYFNLLVVSYSKENHLNIEKLISATNSEIIRSFFTNRIETEKSITSKKKYKVFDEFLSEKMYMESQTSILEEESFD